MRRTGAYDRLDLVRRLRKTDERRDHTASREPVALVRPQLLRLRQERGPGKGRLDGLDERTRQPHACQSMAVATAIPAGVDVLADAGPAAERILTSDALEFVATLQRELGPRREELLALRRKRQAEIDEGGLPDFLPQTAHIREDRAWRVAETPADLQDRRVEITGPVERKMMINALNSGANVFMADFEDANSPTWENCVEGQANLIDAVERTISLEHGREAATG